MDRSQAQPVGYEAKTSAPWMAIAGITATVSVFAIAQGLTYPLLSFILERQGTSAGLIGLSAAMTPLGIIASAPFIPSLARRFGGGATTLTCACLAAGLVALIGWSGDLWMWFPLRFLLGVVINPLYVLSEVWMVMLAPAQQRGRVIGIYTTIISAGFAAGPLSLILVGSRGWPPFAVGVAAFLACGLSLACVLKRLPDFDNDGGTASIRSFLPLGGVLLPAVFVTAAFEQVILSLLPVYGLGYGIGETGMSALLTVLIAGNIALQVPLGFAAERWTARSVMVACALATALGCLLLPLLIDTALLWPLVFLWGAFSYGIYTVALVELGERFSGSMLVAGNAAFGLMWGAGGLASPPATGAIMDAFGLQGLPITLGVISLALAVAGRRR